MRSQYNPTDNPFVAVVARMSLPDAEELRRIAEDDAYDTERESNADDAVVREIEEELTLDIVRDDARHAMTYPDIAEAARRWAPLMGCMFGLVAPEDLAYEIHGEFEEYFDAEGFPMCSGQTLAGAIAGLLLFGEDELGVAALQNGGR